MKGSKNQLITIKKTNKMEEYMEFKLITLEEYGIISNNGIQLDCRDYNGCNAFLYQENLFFCYERWGYVEVYTISIFEFLHKKAKKLN